MNTLTGSYVYSSLMHDKFFLSHGVIHAVKKGRWLL